MGYIFMNYNETVFYIRDKSLAVKFGLMGFKNGKKNN